KDPTLPAAQTLLSPDGAILAVARFTPPNMKSATASAGAGAGGGSHPPYASMSPTGGAAGATGAAGGAGAAAGGPQIDIWANNDVRSTRHITFDASRPAPAILGFAKNNQLITAAPDNGNANANGGNKSLVQVWDTRSAQPG